jgi:hypothetical protein
VQRGIQQAEISDAVASAMMTDLVGLNGERHAARNPPGF